MLLCDHIETIQQGKDYRYCDKDGTILVGDHWFCFEHAGNAEDEHLTA